LSRVCNSIAAISRYFITTRSAWCELEEPYILITDKKISAIADILPVLERFLQISKNLVIIARTSTVRRWPRCREQAARHAECTRRQGPGFGDRRKAMLEDIAVLTGGVVISEEVGRKLDSATIQDLGRARKVVSNKDETTIVEAAARGTIKVASSRSCADQRDHERFRSREAAGAAGQVGRRRRGDQGRRGHEVELKEKKHRVEDALSATRAPSRKASSRAAARRSCTPSRRSIRSWPS